MSMISNLVDSLRYYQNISEIGYSEVFGVNEICKDTADTIESLSAKLVATNIEQLSTSCSGGWIPCKDKLPEESGYYLVTIESTINDENIRTVECYCFHKDIKLWAKILEPEFVIEESIIAWQPLPEPPYFICKQNSHSINEKVENRKITICEPKYLGENVVIGCRIGECNCGNIIRSYQNFCDQCGIKLEWGNVWKNKVE